MSVRLLALGALLSGLALAGLGSESRHSVCERCNVVLISIDTLRADHLGAYGYERPTTPRIDAFANRAVLFENAISQSAWTRPAHASMLTGLYPSEHGIIGVVGRPALPPSLPTLATVLKDNGYRTAAFTGGANLSSHFGYDRGFAVYRSPGRRLEDGVSEAHAWLSGGTEPFLLFLHGFDVHRPYRALDADRAALGVTGPRPRGMQRLCRQGSARSELAPHIDEYDAAIRRADRSVGALLDMLEDLELADRTVVVLTSDHGEEFLEHGLCFHIRALYRETVHVPLVVSVPGLPARRVASVVPASASVGPTILAVLGLTGLPGPSLRPLLGGQPRARGLDPYVVSETGARDPWTGRYGRIRSLTSGREKLVSWIDAGRVQYFDLARDPDEGSPIVDGPRAQALTAELERWSARHLPVAEPASAPVLPPGLARKLRRLGYVE
jgi:arylsulfatase A-like enzyme